MRLDSGAFRLDHAEVTVGEVLAAALAGGSLVPVLQEVSSRNAAAQAAIARGMGVDEDALQEAFDAWRQERDLIAAEELERWLEQHAITVEDVAAFLEEGLLCDALGEVDVELGDEGEPLEMDELLRRLPNEALLGGTLAELVEAFALRACAPDPAQGVDARIAEARRWMLAEAGFEDEASYLHAADLFGVEPHRARWALDRELAFRMHQQDVLTQDALRQALAEVRDDLRKYDLISATFRTEDVAREVAACVREDRDPFRRAASRAGEAAHQTTWFHLELERAPFGTRLASTRERELVGPALLPDGRATLGQLRSTHDPELGDPEVLQRVERRLVERSLRRALQQRVLFPARLLGSD